eukprot:1002577-Prymnesium_polylepis.2
MAVCVRRRTRLRGDWLRRAVAAALFCVARLAAGSLTAAGCGEVLEVAGTPRVAGECNGVGAESCAET